MLLLLLLLLLKVAAFPAERDAAVGREVGALLVSTVGLKVTLRLALMGFPAAREPGLVDDIKGVFSDVSASAARNVADDVDAIVAAVLLYWPGFLWRELLRRRRLLLVF